MGGIQQIGGKRLPRGFTLICCVGQVLNSMKEFWAAVWAVVWKDLRIEGRTRQTISVMVMFSLATIIMFNFALGMAANINLAAGRSEPGQGESGDGLEAAIPIRNLPCSGVWIHCVI